MITILVVGDVQRCKHRRYYPSLEPVMPAAAVGGAGLMPHTTSVCTHPVTEAEAADDDGAVGVIGPAACVVKRHDCQSDTHLSVIITLRQRSKHAAIHTLRRLSATHLGSRTS